MDENGRSNNRMDKPKMPWELAEEITGGQYTVAGGGVAAKISVLKLDFPKYSFEIGWKAGGTGMFLRHFRAGQDLSDLHDVVTSAKLRIEALVDESEAKRKAEEDNRAAWAAGAKERAAHKKKNHEANFARRREEDRARARGGTGGGQKKQKQG